MSPKIKPKKIQRRRCTACRSFGHSRPRCTFGKTPMVRQVEKSVEEQVTALGGVPLESGKIKEVKKGPHIFVHITPNAKSSPHVVDLKSFRDAIDFSKMPVYEEVRAKNIIREKVDFGLAVRRANMRSLSESKFIPPPTRNGAKTIAIPKIKARRRSFGLLEKVNGFFRDATHSFHNLIPHTLGQWKAMAYGSMALFVILSVPLPAIAYYQQLKLSGGILVSESTNGFMALQSSTVAAFASDLTKAEQDLVTALASFSAASSIVEKDHNLLFSVAKLLPVVGTQVHSRELVLSAGEHLALGNTYLVKGIDEAKQKEQEGFLTSLQVLRDHLFSAAPQYKQALAEMSAVDNSVIPVAYQKTFEDFKVLFGSFVADMDKLVSLADTMKLLLGSDDLRRYLVVFQNNYELRPTGGFMGSFALVDIQKGKVVKIDVPGGGSYDLKGQLPKFVKPPLPLQLVNGRWEFQDANWFPDFPSTARKLEWFYQQSRGATVDGVIAINASVLEKLLAVIGPVASENKEKEIVLNADNVIHDLQVQVEHNYDKAKNQPKEIIGELLSSILTRLPSLSSIDKMRLLSTLNESVGGKEIQVYSNDVASQKKLSEFGWGGEILPTSGDQDYLMVVGANLQGQKSDAKIKQTITHEVVVSEDGKAIDHVTVRREHTGVPGEIFYGGVNISYLRFYVPSGAKLLEARGFVYPPEEAFHTPESWYSIDADLRDLEIEKEIDVKSGTRITEEFGKTVFGNWMITEPGKASEVYLSYELPFKVINAEVKNKAVTWQGVGLRLAGEDKFMFSNYSVLAQKQSGSESEYSLRVIYPDGWLPAWRSSDEIDLAKNGALYDQPLKADTLIGLVFEKAK